MYLIAMCLEQDGKFVFFQSKDAWTDNPEKASKYTWDMVIRIARGPQDIIVPESEAQKMCKKPEAETPKEEVDDKRHFLVWPQGHSDRATRRRAKDMSDAVLSFYPYSQPSSAVFGVVEYDPKATNVDVNRLMIDFARYFKVVTERKAEVIY